MKSWRKKERNEFHFPFLSLADNRSEKSDKTKFEWIELNIFYLCLFSSVASEVSRQFSLVLWLFLYPISQQRLNHFLIVCPFLKQIKGLLIARKSFNGRKMKRMNRRMSQPLQLTSCFAATYSFRSRLVRSNFLLQIPLQLQPRKGINTINSRALQSVLYMCGPHRRGT